MTAKEFLEAYGLEDRHIVMEGQPSELWPILSELLSEYLEEYLCDNQIYPTSSYMENFIRNEN